MFDLFDLPGVGRYERPAHTPMIENPWLRADPYPYRETPYDIANDDDWMEYVEDQDLEPDVLKAVLNLTCDDPFALWEMLPRKQQEDLVLRWVEQCRSTTLGEMDLCDDYNAWKCRFD